MKRTAYLHAPPLEQRRSRRAPAARAAAPSRARGHSKLIAGLPSRPCRGSRRACAASRRRSRARRGGRRRARARAASSCRSAAAAAAKRSRSLRLRRVDAQLAARLRVDEPEVADVGQLLLARVADLDRERPRGAPASSSSARAPVARPAEVGDHDDERARREPARRRGAAPRRATSRRPRRRSGSRRSAQQHAEQARSALPRRQASAASRSPKVTTPRRLPRRDASVADARGRRPRRRPTCAGRRCRRSSTARCRAASQVVSARSATCDADVRLAGAGGHVPVDLADVVAGHVRPHLRELRAVPERCGTVLAGEQPFDPAAHA